MVCFGPATARLLQHLRQTPAGEHGSHDTGHMPSLTSHTARDVEALYGTRLALLGGAVTML